MKVFNKLIMGILCAGASFACLAAVEVGQVSYVRGVVTGQIDGQQPRIIGKGIGLHNGETLNTGSRAFALIKFDDGTKMTLRPNTTFRIEHVNAQEDRENALFSLIRGGLRALTGTISKFNPNAFRISTPVATIGIRGTEFDARLCEGIECEEEERASGKTAQRETRVVGRISLLRGKASATEDGQKTRVLNVGAAVYERDQVQTGIKSFVVIGFNDKTRVTLSPNSAFRIEEHEFKPEQPDENNSFFSFLQGGLRLVTGAIGRLNQKAFRVATPTATIGIRGTGFDLLCEGVCVSTNAMHDPARDSLLGKFINFFVKPAFALGDGNGMYAKVWSGAIELQLGSKTVLLKNGRTAYLKNNFSQPQLIPDIPARLRSMDGAPRPDKVNIQEDMFSESDQTSIDPGLYVNVRKGDVAVQGVDGNTINIGSGEAVLAGPSRAIRLGFVPVFQKFDRIPDPAKITLQSEKLINLFGTRGAGKESIECTVR
ncbi:MAG: FecR domain-containing protein [Gammaproteobacteria bacterium]|nr:FecR domain-containing protein [Gammaproteobacteria bacterium]